MQTRTLEYSDGKLTLEAYVAIPDNISGKRPAVIVLHREWGHSTRHPGKLLQSQSSRVVIDATIEIYA